MTTIEHHIGAGFGDRWQAFSARFSRICAGVAWTLLWLPRFWKARSDLAGLAAMSECERRDIGLTAYDIENALTLPVERDPTQVLARMVESRRLRRET
ncbi:hypothetical protein [Mesorhizobium sp.]|uniref:hypothetical protein n=1 Tax=Mesorhizobium sp. TaxID=1871066 RepID=UPI000FE8F532|nr:hypothetical protein [Mesorhizobium sp.]RWC34237.1 MAG: hypothetical protein EOS27_00985 [Mesorhizobium sp.]TIX01612.1 MAG: hypothetical protein E5V59_04525 [Mesorhizobium sp.]TIX26048.1 MAG: hypothetical protein E5V35_12095 [Mesorhizobium sp.]